MPICSIDVCGGPYAFVKCTFFPARSFLKKLLMAFLPSQLRTIYVIGVYFDQRYSQISPQRKISIANINKTRCLPSRIHPPWRQLPSCAKDVRARSKMAVPLRPTRKHRFFIRITISQYHDIDISYIDIDIGKNAFSMSTLHIILHFTVQGDKKRWWVKQNKVTYYHDYHKKKIETFSTDILTFKKKLNMYVLYNFFLDLYRA